MNQINLGCQFYTWQMSGNRYVGKLPHILNTVRSSHFTGIEPETIMLGSYYDDPASLKKVLDQYDLVLAALTLVCDWAGSQETESERQGADRIIAYLKYFQGTHLVLCQMPGKDRKYLQSRQANLIACVNFCARRAADQGIVCSFHPNSPMGSLFRDAGDYKILLNGLDSNVVGFAPDTGHIARGGMNVIEIFKEYRELIKHVHFKDINAVGEWTGMGEGIIDFPWIVKMLLDTGYHGW
ncbi:MAG: TIM barrel protein, partial [Anaerolineaceae bacterium]|nr:TIM barrel protein [Anaerolineaceae bacterium]